MHVLYIHQFYAGPEAPGPAQPRELVRVLAQRGHRVDVLACDFNAYNEQDEPEESIHVPGGGAIRVHRIKTPRKIRHSLKNRLRSYITFAWRAYSLAGKMNRPDIVFATIQPLFAGYAGLRLARKYSRPFMLEMRDLWPDALVVKKAITPWQARPLQKMAHALYFGCDRMAVLTPGLKTEILKKGVPPQKVDLFPNGIKKPDSEPTEETRQAVRKQYGWSDQYVAVYTGTHTEVTAVDVFVRAAAALQDRTDIRIDLFGTGQTKPAAMALANELNLQNIHFHDPVPKSKIPEILAGADAALMSIFKSPLVHIYFENKLSDYMGAKRPILAALGGVQADLIEREKIGRCVPSLDGDGLAATIRDAADHPDQFNSMGEAGYQFVYKHLAQAVILNQYADTIEAVQRGESETLEAWDPLMLS